MKDTDIIKIASDVFEREIEAIQATQKVINSEFIRAAKLILKSSGKIITMGIGKSGAIAKKIAGTLTSTGSTAVFVHPVECLHGDMGIINPEDIALVLSKSGESDEIRRLMGFLRQRGVKIISITARPESHLGQESDIVISMNIPNEACPMGLAPMASTTVQMVLGDALAAVLIKLHDFKPDDFAVFHPAGSLGKRLLLKVEDFMHSGDENPRIKMGTLMREALVVMTSKAMGAVLIVDEKGILKGILTDGDLRRAIQKHGNLLDLPVDDLMTKNPIRVRADEKAIDALHLMEKRRSQISVLPVVDKQRRAVGILRLHDLVLGGL